MKNTNIPTPPEDGQCICDGARFDPEQKHPFLVHPDCPRHASRPTPPEDVMHFAPYGSYTASCGAVVPSPVGWDAGEYEGAPFTTRRDRTTCPRCLARFSTPPKDAAALIKRTLRNIESLDLDSEITGEGTAWGSILREAKRDLTAALCALAARPLPESEGHAST